MIGVILGIAMTLMDVWAGLYSLLIPDSTTVLLMVIICLMNRGGYYFLARIFITLVAFGYLFISSNYAYPGHQTEYLYLIVVLLTMVLFDRIWLQLGTIALSLVAFFVPNLFFHHYTEGFFDVVNVSTLYIILFITIRHFISLNNKSEQKLEEDKKIIASQNDKLEKVQEFQNNFFVNVAHEIRTPLTIILGNTRWLQDSIATSDNTPEELREIQKQSLKIQQMVDDVLELSKMSQADLVLQRGWFSLPEMVKVCTASFQSLFTEKDIRLDVSIETDVDFQFYGSMTHLERMVNNLLSNAYKFSPAGSTVTITLSKVSKQVFIEVSDQGIGIEDWEKERVFSRFYQSQNNINQAGGTGIGLAYCRETAALHRGTITVNDRKRGGTVFRVSLPLEKELVQPTPVVSRVGTDQTRSSVLVVEDVPDMQKYLSKILQNLEVAIASSAVKALEYLNDYSFDLIITDYMMPGMNGKEFIQEIRQRGIQIPVIVLTASKEQQLKVSLLRLGIDDFITKPFDNNEFLARVNNSLKNNQNRIAYIEEERVKEEPSAFVSKLNRFISENHKKHYFNVQLICDEFALSYSSLYRKTKSESGLTPKELIQEIKLNEAFDRLETQPKMSAKELALSVGYQNYTHFAEMFKGRYGVELK